jgi:phosphoribosylformylglycinamidine cyclo-ligase
MPGMYHGADYDLAGFCVGVVERSQVLDGSRVQAGDAVIGLASSGVHSNGYSLVRKLIGAAGATERTQLAGRPLFDRLLEPTRIYVKSMLRLADSLPVSAFAHITGGGLTDNIPRVLPEGLEARLVRGHWHRDPVFDWLAATGGIAPAEMYRTFNCGIGMVAVVPARHAEQALMLLNAAGEQATLIGEIRAGSSGVVIDG